MDVYSVAKVIVNCAHKMHTMCPEGVNFSSFSTAYTSLPQLSSENSIAYNFDVEHL